MYIVGKRKSWNILELRGIVVKLVFQEDKLSSVVYDKR